MICAALKDACSATIHNMTTPIWKQMSVSARIVLVVAVETMESRLRSLAVPMLGLQHDL